MLAKCFKVVRSKFRSSLKEASVRSQSASIFVSESFTIDLNHQARVRMNLIYISDFM